MKKTLTVVLVLCLLLSLVTSALAEKKIYQDDMAPELVAVEDGQGGKAFALIRNAQGNVLAAIPTNEMIKRICVGERENEQDPELAALLEKGLAALLADEHHTDPAMVDTDLFYVEIPEAYAAMFADGTAYLDMTFDPHILENGDELVVLYSVNGEEWNEITDVNFAGNGTVQFGVQQSGLLTFMIKHTSELFENVAGNAAFEQVSSSQTAVETNSNFTPSVSGKLAPATVTFEQNGETYAATILNTAEATSTPVPAKSWVVVTPLSERKYTPDVVTYEHLEWAYDMIAEGSIMETTDDEHGAKLGEVVNSMLAAKGTGLTYEDLTVSDLIEVSVYGEYLQQLKASEANLLEITFDMGLQPDDTLIVMCASGIEYWHVMDAETVIINQDGTVTLRMKHPAVLALMVERADTIDPNAAELVTAP